MNWKARLWNVGDIIIVDGDSYKVSGVYLGAVNCVSMVGLIPMTERFGSAGGPIVTEMLMPLHLLNAAIGDRAGHYKSVI